VSGCFYFYTRAEPASSALGLSSCHFFVLRAVRWALMAVSSVCVCVLQCVVGATLLATLGFSMRVSRVHTANALMLPILELSDYPR